MKSMSEIISQAENNIRTAIEDYKRHTCNTGELDDISDGFIERLARDSSYAKQNLRELFSKSPVYDEELDAIVINGTRTHESNYELITEYVHQLFCKKTSEAWDTDYDELYKPLCAALRFFTEAKQSNENEARYINALKKIAPKAYAPGKKKSRVLRALCDALGVTDNTAGSDFQKYFALAADEMNSRKIDYKLFVSINPAHFLTMSNPKCDERGNTLTSCHSLNSTNYEYNNGCSGYARDEVSFIVFTVNDPSNRETLNNRKTTRQIFAYRPGSGLLLQSRLYNTNGGTSGAQKESEEYRNLIQKEFSMLEEKPNLWNTYSSTGEYSNYVEIGYGFGGYPDWTYSDFDGHISFRKDCDRDKVEPLKIGEYGLCIKCGDTHSNGLYCEDCVNESKPQCYECGDHYDDDDLTTAFDSNGDGVLVCNDCLENHYYYCEVCNEYHHIDCINCIDDQYVCDNCRDEYYEQCEDCDEWCERGDMHCVHDSNGDEIYVCDRCIDNYVLCENCDEYCAIYDMGSAYDANGNVICVCKHCKDDFETCPHCGELIETRSDGCCPHCGALIEDTEEA